MTSISPETRDEYINGYGEGRIRRLYKVGISEVHVHLFTHNSLVWVRNERFSPLQSGMVTTINTSIVVYFSPTFYWKLMKRSFIGTICGFVSSNVSSLSITTPVRFKIKNRSISKSWFVHNPTYSYPRPTPRLSIKTITIILLLTQLS